MIELLRFALVCYGFAILVREPGLGAKFLVAVAALEFVLPRLL